ncbi:MAG: hypothetical protein GY713_02470 [Actinomycetia bacterium]|nr:hypothetical protein [Actinomycetes bacterium]
MSATPRGLGIAIVALTTIVIGTTTLLTALAAGWDAFFSARGRQRENMQPCTTM